MSAEVSIVMLARDHWSHTEAALRSLALTEGVDFETVVVDNGSSGAAVSKLEELAASETGARLRLRCHYNPTNLGVASGRNQGAQLCEAPMLLFLDNDVEIIDPSWLAALLSTIRDNPSSGVVGGVLLNADDDRTIQFAGGTVDGRGHVGFATDVTPDPTLAGRARSTTFCLGACFLTPRGLFDALGGFDATYDPMDYEDIDYCFRIAEAELGVTIALDARVVHHGHVTTGTRGFSRVRHYLVNGRTFVRRWSHRLPAQSALAERALLSERS